MPAELQIFDYKTKAVFKVPMDLNTAYFTTKDGVRVKIHPAVVVNLVKQGGDFHGHTLIGTRALQKI